MQFIIAVYRKYTSFLKFVELIQICKSDFASVSTEHEIHFSSFSRQSNIL